MSSTNNVSYPEAVTRETLGAIKWINRADHPLQDNVNINIDVNTEQCFQTWDGFAGAVSELGAKAIKELSEEKQTEFFEAIFGKEGLGFSWIRLPVGSSDFDLDAYSFSETPEDYEMEHFSIERDKNLIIPYLNRAKAVNPNLQIHASPWAPPAWMKVSGSMVGRENGRFRDEEKVLKAYALYLRLFVEAYEAEGLPISRLMVQNEMDSAGTFPTCGWEPELFVRFHVDYLKPEFEAHNIKTEVWAGTYRTMTGMQSHHCFNNPDFRAFVKGCSFQYSYPETIKELSVLYPGTRFMHAESVCNRGDNSFDEAVAQFDDYLNCMKANIDVYSYWNVVLSENPVSTWGWKQNSLVTANTQTGELIYNEDYKVYKMFADHIQHGAVRIMSFSYLADTLAIKNPDGSLVIFARNLEEEREAKVSVDAQTQMVKLPGHSICAIKL